MNSWSASRVAFSLIALFLAQLVFAADPTSFPTFQPTVTFEPTSVPTMEPSVHPTLSPVTFNPTNSPVFRPTSNPTSTPPTSQPTGEPTGQPTGQPSSQPTNPTSVPTTRYPTVAYTNNPTRTFKPTGQPTTTPTGIPTVAPISYPTSAPSNTFRPTSQPTGAPSVDSAQPTGVYETHSVFGAVQIDNPDSGFCQPLAINITLGFNQAIGYVGQWFIVKTPGLTSGPCKSPSDGSNMTDIAVQDNSWFKVNFYEGTWQNYYDDSYVRLELVQAPVVVGQAHTLLIDRSNRLKRNCMSTSYWAVQEYRSIKTYGTIGYVNITSFADNVYRQCYAYSSKVEFFPKFQKFPTQITLTLALAFRIYPGDTITLYLPGFTNAGRYLSNIDRTIVSSAAGLTQLSSVAWSTDFNWTNTWSEGVVGDTFADSYATFTMQDRHYKYPQDVVRFPDRNGVFNITITRASQISAYCGQHSNYSGFAFSVRGLVYNVSKTSLVSADGIGPGCKAQNDCSGNGICNYCTSTCECFNGFGSALDLQTAVTNTFSADCSSRTCPKGPAMRSGGKDSLSTATMHRTMECSNNGNCDRKTGQCTCFEGYGGAACERMECPRVGSAVCSNRGICLPQSALPIRTDALPLSNSTSHSYVRASGDSGSTWDANFGRACVCDSSWEVGLGSGQTQLAEYFGPACQYRRCPSGNNPATPADDTNCTGVAQTEGGGVGLPGNLCHIDCSGRGTCDYNTGICSCYTGFGMHNCGTRV